MKPVVSTLSVILSLVGFGVARAEVRHLSNGHVDVGIGYSAADRSLSLFVGADSIGRDFGVDDAVLVVKPAARTVVPDSPAYAFLGAAGASIWLLPQSESEELLFLGLGGEDLPAGVFVADQLRLSLRGVNGPGEVVAYEVEALGAARVVFSSRDGIGTNDVTTVVAGGHSHLNWAFTRPGTYQVALEVSGRLTSDGTTVSSGVARFRFDVGASPGVVTHGHTDLALGYNVEADAWDLVVGSEALDAVYAADQVRVQVGPEAMVRVPADPRFAFLGSTGDAVWILPQAEREDLVFLGFGGEDIPGDVFQGALVRVALRSVEGPGAFAAYRVDGLGAPEVVFNTRDGITESDVAGVQAGGDAHLAWAFERDGEYRVTVEASGFRKSDGQRVASGPVTYLFHVQKPLVRLARNHVDLRVVYSAQGLENLTLVARDEDQAANYGTNECVLVVGESAKLTLPAGTPFGPEGASLHALPQSQNPDLLYLGVSAEGIASGTFVNGLALRLLSVSGPGDFFVWQSESFGAFDVVMNSADGISAADQMPLILGSHGHFNWGFTRPGRYRIGLQASGRRPGDSVDLMSPVAGFAFEVLPLPAAPPTLSLTGHPSGNVLILGVSGEGGSVCQLETSTDLRTWKSWRELALDEAGAGQVDWVVDGAQVFFRARLP